MEFMTTAARARPAHVDKWCTMMLHASLSVLDGAALGQAGSQSGQSSLF